MTSRHYTREGYEKMYYSLAGAAGLRSVSISTLSDYYLLKAINEVLFLLNCIPLNKEELEMELH